MDWNNYKKKYEDITGETINTVTNTKKSQGINDLTKYTLITRDNVNTLEIGCHIKYAKNVLDINANKTYKKIFNGGFLLETVNGDKMHTLDLVLKSNITWKLRFIRFKVYAKLKKDFHHENKNKVVEDHFRNENAEIIKQRKNEINKKVQDKLKLIQSKQKKDHYVLFGKSIIIDSDDNKNNYENDLSDNYEDV